LIGADPIGATTTYAARLAQMALAVFAHKGAGGRVIGSEIPLTGGDVAAFSVHGGGLPVILAMMPALIWRLFDGEKFLARNPPGYVDYQESAISLDAAVLVTPSGDAPREKVYGMVTPGATGLKPPFVPRVDAKIRRLAPRWAC
jgi:hypothetical protein